MRTTLVPQRGTVAVRTVAVRGRRRPQRCGRSPAGRTRLPERADHAAQEVGDPLDHHVVTRGIADVKPAAHFGEKQLAAIVLWIATTNFFNRINATTRTQAPQNWG
jgi:hypothetical protein